MMLFKPKTSKQDYTRNMLPRNRRQVYKDVVKLHFWQLLLLGLLIFAFALPIHIYSLTEDMYVAEKMSSLSQNSTAEERLNVAMSVVSFSNTKALMTVLLLALFSVGFAGLTRIIKRYAFLENVYFRYDFAMGIKQNIGQILPLALIVGVLNFACTYIKNLSSLIVDGEIYQYLGLIPTVLCLLLLVPVAGYVTVCVSVYKNSFRQNVRLGFVLYFKNLWKTLLAVLCCVAIFSVQAIPNIWCHLIGRAVSSICIPFIMLGWWLFAYNRLDEKINVRHFPELVGKGTFNNELETKITTELSTESSDDKQ